LSGPKKDLEHTIWRPFGGDCKFFSGGGKSPLENKELLLGINAGTGGAPNFKIWSKSLFYLGFDTTVLFIHHSFLPSVLPHQSHLLCSYWTSLSLIRHMHYRRSTGYRSGTWDHYSSRPTSLPSQASPTFTVLMNCNTPMTPNCLFLYPHPTTCPISMTSHAVLTPCMFGPVQMAWSKIPTSRKQSYLALANEPTAILQSRHSQRCRFSVGVEHSNSGKKNFYSIRFDSRYRIDFFSIRFSNLINLPLVN